MKACNTQGPKGTLVFRSIFYLLVTVPFVGHFEFDLVEGCKTLVIKSKLSNSLDPPMNEMLAIKNSGLFRIVLFELKKTVVVLFIGLMRFSKGQTKMGERENCLFGFHYCPPSLYPFYSM